MEKFAQHLDQYTVHSVHRIFFIILTEYKMKKVQKGDFITLLNFFHLVFFLFSKLILVANRAVISKNVYESHYSTADHFSKFIK